MILNSPINMKYIYFAVYTDPFNTNITLFNFRFPIPQFIGSPCIQVLNLLNVCLNLLLVDVFLQGRFKNYGSDAIKVLIYFLMSFYGLLLDFYNYKLLMEINTDAIILTVSQSFTFKPFSTFNIIFILYLNNQDYKRSFQGTSLQRWHCPVYNI